MSLQRRPGPSRRVKVHEVRGGRVLRREDRLATEEPLEIRLGWPGRPAQRVVVTMRTPGHDFELAAGFLHNEGLTNPHGHIHAIAYCNDHTLTPEEELNVVTVELTRPPLHRPDARYDGATAGSSACGVCGKQSIGDALAAAGPLPGAGTPAPVDPVVIAALPDRIRDAQKVFSLTGGLHAAALCAEDGTPLTVREDVGRHNAVDKVVGSRVLAGADTAAPVLWVSGRIGFELAQKAVAAGVRIIVAVGAPSSLAVELADASGLCMVGFVREDRFVVYTWPAYVGV